MYGFDVRDAAAEQVEAMGAKFLRVDFQEDGSAQSWAPDSYYTTWGGSALCLLREGLDALCLLRRLSIHANYICKTKRLRVKAQAAF